MQIVSVCLAFVCIARANKKKKKKVVHVKNHMSTFSYEKA